MVEEKKKQINNSSESQRGTAEKVVSHLSSVFASLVQESREGTMLQRRFTNQALIKHPFREAGIRGSPLGTGLLD